MNALERLKQSSNAEKADSKPIPRRRSDEALLEAQFVVRWPRNACMGR